MATEVLMPKLGLTMTEGTIEEWRIKEGQPVKKGEVLFSVATDKLTNDVEADADGVLLKILLPEGETASCKSVVAYIGQPGEAIPGAAPAAESAPAPAAAAVSTDGPKTVLVIGGGPGGYVAAIRAAQLGGKVTLIEKAEIGGTCLNRGCMPTKALLHSAEVYEAATKSASCGIIGKDVQVDWSAVQNNRASVTAKLTSGVKALIKMNKIKLVEGEAVFTGPKTVTVEGKDYSADKIIIAAGSYPIIPGIPGVKESSAVIDSTGALTIYIPKLEVTLPLYLGANDENMANGAAVLGQTSVPIGGINTNAVIAGHRGWNGYPYFLNLDELQVGDLVYIDNVWTLMKYEVADIQVVSPDDVDAIKIQDGHDLVTLLTCHPPNTGGRQRLLVFCERVIE